MAEIQLERHRQVMVELALHPVEEIDLRGLNLASVRHFLQHIVLVVMVIGGLGDILLEVFGFDHQAALMLFQLEAVNVLMGWEEPRVK